MLIRPRRKHTIRITAEPHRPTRDLAQRARAAAVGVVVDAEVCGARAVVVVPDVDDEGRC